MRFGLRKKTVRVLARVERWLDDTPAASTSAPVWNAPTEPVVAEAAPAVTVSKEPVVQAAPPAETEPSEAVLTAIVDKVRNAEAPTSPLTPPATPKATTRTSLAPVAPEPTAVEAEAVDDVVGPPIALDQLEQVLDDMVRPALQSDGGDITVVKVERNNDIYVRLVGACSTCPSSIMTLRMGVERLLREEFPQMGELIQVEDLV